MSWLEVLKAHPSVTVSFIAVILLSYFIDKLFQLAIFKLSSTEKKVDSIGEDIKEVSGVVNNIYVDLKLFTATFDSNFAVKIREKLREDQRHV